MKRRRGVSVSEAECSWRIVHATALAEGGESSAFEVIVTERSSWSIVSLRS